MLCGEQENALKSAGRKQHVPESGREESCDTARPLTSLSGNACRETMATPGTARDLTESSEAE